MIAESLKQTNQLILVCGSADQPLSAPYPPILVTVDTVLVLNECVLMVERKGYPGKGLMAVPGGFVEKNERLLDSCLRELREETCLNIPI